MKGSLGGVENYYTYMYIHYSPTQLPYSPFVTGSQTTQREYGSGSVSKVSPQELLYRQHPITPQACCISTALHRMYV